MYKPSRKLIADVGKKTKTTGVLKPHHVRSHLWVFMNCQIRNPEFDSQTKENMTSNVSAFGSKCAITEDFIKKVKKSGLMDKLLEVVQFRGQQQLKKGDGKKKSRLSGVSLQKCILIFCVLLYSCSIFFLELHANLGHTSPMQTCLPPPLSPSTSCIYLRAVHSQFFS